MIELPTLEEPARWNHSASSVEEFLLCGFRYAYIKACVPWTDNEATLRGKQIHAAADWWATRRFEDEAFDPMTELFAEQGPLGGDELREWLRNLQPGVQGIVPGKQEFWVRMQLDGCERRFVGRVDLLASEVPWADGPCVVDYKTVTDMGRVPTAYELQRSVQGLSYALATDVPSVAFIYVSRYHEARVAHHTYTEKELSHGRHFLVHTCRAIEAAWKTGRWPLAQPGGLCSPRWCPAWKAGECYGAA